MNITDLRDEDVARASGVGSYLDGRQARCAYCQTPAPSSERLPFFEFRGEGSKQATDACKVCRCYEVAHHPRGDDAPASMRGKVPSIIGDPHPFQPHGAWEFDLYYCGCRGWE